MCAQKEGTQVLITLLLGKINEIYSNKAHILLLNNRIYPGISPAAKFFVGSEKTILLLLFSCVFQRYALLQYPYLVNFVLRTPVWRELSVYHCCPGLSIKNVSVREFAVKF